MNSGKPAYIILAHSLILKEDGIVTPPITNNPLSFKLSCKYGNPLDFSIVPSYKKRMLEKMYFC